MRKKAAFPRYAEYNAPLKYFMEQGLDIDCVLQPKLTRRTNEIGAKYSPDFVCTPFKTTLGSMIEALEAGADTIIMTYGSCKLGYFGELQEQVLREMGYEFDFVNLTEYDTGKKIDLFRGLKRINPKVKLTKVIRALVDGIKMADYIDEITAEYYGNVGFATDMMAFSRAYDRFIADMYAADSKETIEAGYAKVKEAFSAIDINKPKNPIRVGVIGEFYTAMDEFSNLETEKKLAKLGVEVHRWMNISNRMLHYPGEDNLLSEIKEYSEYTMGADSTANIWAAKDYGKRGFDGVVHIKSANCTPEIDLMPVLQKVSEDYKMPILYLTFDVHTSDVGLVTRLEAFYDMISMRKKVAADA